MKIFDRLASVSLARLIIATLTLLTTRAVSCEAQGDPANPLLALLPTAAHAAPPAWVKPGLRLTYYTATASARGKGRDWKPDKNGAFVDAQGNHWSGDEKQAIGGHGYIQYDVVALDSGHAAMQQSNYMLNLQEPLSLLSRQGMLATPGTGGDLWCAPALLHGLADGMHAGYQVYRAPYKIGDTPRTGVWIHQESSGGTLLYIYDRATGVLLHFASAGKPQKGAALGQDEFENTSNVMLYQTTLSDQRILKLPWMTDDISSWAAHVGPVQFEGVSTTASPGFGSTAVRSRVTDTITPQSHGSRWALLSATLQGSGLSHQTQLIGGNAQIGSPWIAPQSLAHLQAGQEIDRDPITKTITRAGRASRNSETVVSEVGATFQFDYHYDSASGNLIGLDMTEHHPYVVKKLQLTLRH